MNTQPSKKDLRTFSLIWFAIFLIIALFPLIKAENLILDYPWVFEHIRMWSLAVSFCFFLIAFTFPKLLTFFYKVWVKLGEFIGGIVSKIILLILFFVLFTPIALVLKIFRADLLHKKLDSKSTSYWIIRTEQPGTLKNQF